ncbi:minor tail protein [Mycobacterium phage Mortcellus]|nr:minor tail protein [Mycobacterium phage Mortcellus]
MTAAAVPGVAPRTDAEWARSVEQRLRALSQPRTARVGPWVLSNVNGNLTATKPGSTLTLDGTAEPVSVDLTGRGQYVTPDQIPEIQTGVLQQLWEQLTGELDPPDDVLVDLANFLSNGLFGQIDLTRLPSLLPLSRIRDIVENLFLNGDFLSADAISPSATDWLVDLTDGVGSRGSATVVADGSSHILYSNTIDVDPGQTLNVSTAVKYLGLTAVGDAIQVRVSAYLGDTLINTTIIDKLTNPSGTLSDWSTTLSGNYVVPGDGSVDNVVTELFVSEGATAGTVKFSRAISKFVGLMPQAYVDGLAAGLAAIWDGIQGRIDDFADLLDVFGGFTVGAGLGQLTDVATRLSKLNPLTGALDAAGLTNIANIPMIAQSRIIGLTDALAAGGQALRDAIVQALTGTSGTGHTDLDVIEALTNIPAAAVQTAIDGAANIEDAIQQAIDSVIAGAGNLVGSGFGFADMIAQLTGLRNATAGANAAVTNLQAQVAGLDPAASSEVVNFGEFVDASTPPSMFTKVIDTGSGSLITSGGKLAWSGSAGREFYLFNGGPLLTDLFEVTAVLPSVPSHGWFGDDSSNYVWLLGRSNNTGTAFVAARYAWDEIRFFSYAGGTFTQMGPTLSAADVLTGGCSISFKGGTVAETRYFEARVNGTKVHSTVDSTPVSLYGSDYRYCGVGVEKGGSYSTGTVNTWAMYDGGSSQGSGVVAGYTSAGLTNLNIWKGTAGEYAAITSKNPNTIYFVKE